MIYYTSEDGHCQCHETGDEEIEWKPEKDLPVFESHGTGRKGFGRWVMYEKINEQLGFMNNDRGQIWKEHRQVIMNEGNQATNVDKTKGQKEQRVSRVETISAMKAMKPDKTAWLSQV